MKTDLDQATGPAPATDGDSHPVVAKAAGKRPYPSYAERAEALACECEGPPDAWSIFMRQLVELAEDADSEIWRLQKATWNPGVEFALGYLKTLPGDADRVRAAAKQHFAKPSAADIATFEALAFLNDIVGDLHETGKTSDTRLSLLQQSVDRLREAVAA